MDYKVLIGEEEFEFSITGSGSTLRVRREGEPLSVDFREIGPDAYSLILDGKTHLVTVRRAGGGLTVHLDGRAYPAIVRRADDGAADADDSSLRGEEKEVRSAMPGIVTRLLVSAGDRVEPRTPLLILEAMKMENEVRSHRKGTVRKVHVQEGKTVEGGALLVTID